VRAEPTARPRRRLSAERDERQADAARRRRHGSGRPQLADRAVGSAKPARHVCVGVRGLDGRERIGADADNLLDRAAAGLDPRDPPPPGSITFVFLPAQQVPDWPAGQFDQRRAPRRLSSHHASIRRHVRLWQARLLPGCVNEVTNSDPGGRPKRRSAPTWPSGPGRQAGWPHTRSGSSQPGRRPRPRIAAARSVRRRTASGERPGNPPPGTDRPGGTPERSHAHWSPNSPPGPGPPRHRRSRSGAPSAASRHLPLSYNQARVVTGSSLMASVLSGFRAHAARHRRVVSGGSSAPEGDQKTSQVAMRPRGNAEDQQDGCGRMPGIVPNGASRRPGTWSRCSRFFPSAGTM